MSHHCSSCAYYSFFLMIQKPYCYSGYIPCGNCRVRYRYGGGGTDNNYTPAPAKTEEDISDKQFEKYFLRLLREGKIKVSEEAEKECNAQMEQRKIRKREEHWQEFKSEMKNCDELDYHGNPSIGYVYWLEDKITELNDKLNIKDEA